MRAASSPQGTPGQASESIAGVVLSYARCSTSEQGRSGFGLDAQHDAVDAWAAVSGRTVEHHSEDGASGLLAPDARPVLSALLNRLADGDDPADTLAVSRLDRLGRSALDVLSLLDRAERERWNVVMLDVAVDTTTPAGLMVATVMAAMARMERDMTAQRTRDALARKAATGARLGRPVSDATRAAAARAEALAAEGLSQHAIADKLTAEQWPRATPAAGPWTARAVGLALHSLHLDRAAEQAAAAHRSGGTTSAPDA
ncbi:recombinase family protein [Candidatus Poriferisodalis sp.]|uniref:recombinase family protein n=1 Tax=Candidatus Poriferisodalis sp. TaxID=3101277 RepID=UPI003B5BC0E3